MDIFVFLCCSAWAAIIKKAFGYLRISNVVIIPSMFLWNGEFSFVYPRLLHFYYQLLNILIYNLNGLFLKKKDI